MVALLALALAAGPAAAPTAHLFYEVPAGLDACPDAAWVRGAVSARLGRDPFDDASPTVVRARIERREGVALEAQVEAFRADGSIGRRRLESPSGDCLELASAMELAITLAIEPLWMTKPPPPRVEVTEAPVVREAPVAPEEAAPAMETPTPRPVRVRGYVGPLATSGGVPRLTAGFVAGGGVRAGAFSVALEGRVLFPVTFDFGYGDADVFSALGSLVPCFESRWFAACGVVSVGAFQVESRVLEERRATSVMAQAGVRLSGRVRLAERLTLVPWGEGAVVLTRTSLVSGSSTLWVSWPVAVSGGVWLEVDFSS